MVAVARPCVTVCLVPEARRGPFVLHGGLAAGLRRAAAAGFRAVEIFPRAAADLDGADRLLARHRLELAAVGTGAGKVVHGLHLLDPDPARRAAAEAFIAAIIDRAGVLGAPAIIGSMRGSFAAGGDRAAATARLAAALARLARRAAGHGTVLLLEPLNRYESDCVNTLAEGAALIERAGEPNLRLLADCFHMNIEEASIPDALRRAGRLVGHVHFADTDRRAAGLAHLDLAGLAVALRGIGYAGYLSAEVRPLPSPTAAMRATLAAFRRHFPTGATP